MGKDLRGRIWGRIFYGLGKGFFMNLRKDFSWIGGRIFYEFGEGFFMDLGKDFSWIWGRIF
jgi:hypothetical protein